jgi:hypothetical protein
LRAFDLKKLLCRNAAVSYFENGMQQHFLPIKIRQKRKGRKENGNLEK